MLCSCFKKLSNRSFRRDLFQRNYILNYCGKTKLRLAHFTKKKESERNRVKFRFINFIPGQGQWTRRRPRGPLLTRARSSGHYHFGLIGEPKGCNLKASVIIFLLLPVLLGRLCLPVSSSSNFCFGFPSKCGQSPTSLYLYIAGQFLFLHSSRYDARESCPDH